MRDFFHGSLRRSVRSAKTAPRDQDAFCRTMGKCRAYGAYGICLVTFPALTGWAKLWRAYGALGALHEVLRAWGVGRVLELFHGLRRG